MRRSTDRILTTHIGSLPRPDDLREQLRLREERQPYDAAAFDARVQQAVIEVVQQQVDVGLDIVADGEMGKNSFVNYIRDRLTGFEGVNPEPYPGPPEAFPEYARSVPRDQRGVFPLNVGPVAWKDRSAVQRDIANLKSALQ